MPTRPCTQARRRHPQKRIWGFSYAFPSCAPPCPFPSGRSRSCRCSLAHFHFYECQRFFVCDFLWASSSYFLFLYFLPALAPNLLRDIIYPTLIHGSVRFSVLRILAEEPRLVRTIYFSHCARPVSLSFVLELCSGCLLHVPSSRMATLHRCFTKQHKDSFSSADSFSSQNSV